MAAVAYDYARVSGVAVKELRRVFGENTTIVSEEGYLGRIHLKIVSDKFNGKGEREKQNYVWDIIHAELDTEAQQAISFILCYSTDKL